MTEPSTIISVDDPVSLVNTRESLSTSFSLAASAGCGKTHILIQRVLALLTHGVPLERLLLLTFTENAAREMRHRLSVELMKNQEEQWALDAINQLPYASIQTLNSFAFDICSTYFFDAGLGSEPQIVDDIEYGTQSRNAFNKKYDSWGNDATHSLFFALSNALELSRTRWNELAMAAEKYVPIDMDEFNVDWTAKSAELLRSISHITQQSQKLCGQMIIAFENAELSSQGSNPMKRLESIVGFARNVAEATTPAEIFDYLSNRARFVTDKRFEAATKNVVNEFEEPLSELRELLGTHIHPIVDTILGYGTHLLVEFINDFRRRRFEQGTISYDESLVLAKRVLSIENNRFDVYNRFSAILVDEFQDTDDTQIAIVQALIDSEGQESAGRLFVVGDVKQSIYKFRGAQVKSYENFVDASDAVSVALEKSYRSVDGVLSVVNQLMSSLLPTYRDMKHDRNSYSEALDHVVLLGGPSGKNADEVRNIQAHDIVASLPNFVGRTITTKEGDRPATLDDVAVLVRATTGLNELIRACEKNGVSYQVDSSELIWDLTFTKVVISIVNAIANPRDFVSIVGSLRSPLFQCTNDDLGEYVENARKHLGEKFPDSLRQNDSLIWNYYSPDRYADQSRVSSALDELFRLHRNIGSQSPVAALSHILHETGLVQSFRRTSPQLVTSISRFLMAIAINFEEANSPSSVFDFAQYLSDMRAHRKSPIRYVPQTDQNSLHIMTIHKSKGLEFPVVYLVPSVTDNSKIKPFVRSYRDGEVFSPDELGIYIKKELHDTRMDSELEFMQDENREEETRLLYVGMTRAEDFLVLCLHDNDRADDKQAYGGVRLLSQALQETGLIDSIPNLDVFPPSSHESDNAIAEPTRPRPLELSHFTQRLESEAILTPSSLDIENMEGFEQGDLSPLLQITKPLHSNRIGTATHRALNIVDFSASPSEIERISRACAKREGIEEHAKTVALFVARALSYEIISQARNSLREIPISGLIGDQFVEGYIDLLVETESGWMIVDYKTDTIDTTFTIESKVHKYSHQMATYSLLLKSIQDIEVAGACLLFLKPSQNGLVPIENLSDIEEKILKTTLAQ